MDIRKFAVEPTARLHLRDANDELMYAGADEKGRPIKPIAVNLYGPGSKQYAKTTANQNNRAVERLRRKGKHEQTVAQLAEERAEYLMALTHSTENLSYDNLEGADMLMAVYMDGLLGFIPDQISRYLGDWSNFSKSSAPSSPSTSDIQPG